MNICSEPDPKYQLHQAECALESERDLARFLANQISQLNHQRAGMRSDLESKHSELYLERGKHHSSLSELCCFFGDFSISAKRDVPNNDEMMAFLAANIRALGSAFMAALPILHFVANPDNWSGSILLPPPGRDSTLAWAQKGLDVIRALVPQYFPQTEKATDETKSKNTDE